MAFMDTLKKWFGKAKETAGDVADKTGDAAEKAWDKTRDVAGDVKDKIEDRVDDMRGKDDEGDEGGTTG